MRRSLALLAFLGLTPALAAPPERPTPPDEAWVEGPEGLRYVDLVAGSGDPLAVGDEAKVQMTVWTHSGDLIYHSADVGGPVAVTLGDGTFVDGIDLGLVGLEAGGVRYLDIPARLAATDPDTPEAEVQPLFVQVERVAQAADKTSDRSPPEDPPEAPEDAWETRPNGMKVAVLREGEGPRAEKGQIVVVEYTGWVADSGVRFDSSLSRAEPFSFTLGQGQVILGWDKGVRGMQVGEQRVLHIPAYMAYGAQERGKIPSFADLLFVVELQAIQ